MLIKRLFFSIILILILPVYALSQTQEIKDYKVTKGDTLWDISEKELSDSFLWPKVWKENPEIKNPDKIYPDQNIRIPLYLLQKEEKKAEPAPEPVVSYSQPKEEAPAMPVEPPKPSYIVDKGLFISSGYIADSVKSLGKITGTPSGWNIMGNNDLVYVKTNDPVNIGDKFYIIRAEQLVNHPVTKKKMGYIIEVLGIAEIAKFQYGETLAKITHAFREVNTNDLLDTYYEMTPPQASGSYRKPDIEGYVVATKNLRILNSMYDVVYLDKGMKDGLEPGDLIRTIEVKKDKIYGEKHKIPHGTIQIINSKDITSTAVVRNSTDSITSGDLIGKLE